MHVILKDIEGGGRRRREKVLSDGLTMCHSVEPVVEKVKSNEGKPPGQRRVPGQVGQPVVLVEPSIRGHFKGTDDQSAELHHDAGCKRVDRIIDPGKRL